MATDLPSNTSERQGETAGTAEQALVARCLAGDADAFKRLYDAHATRLYNLAYRMSGTAAEAEDLLQEIFLQAFRKLSSFRGRSSLGTWLYRMGINLCLDRARSKQGKMERATVGIEDERGALVVPIVRRRSDAVLDRLDLEKAVEQLPASYKAAFLLHDVEGFEHHEVGAMLGIAEGTSKSLVHKARLRLRALLGPAADR
ncbi:MAG: RNA polymerase sigma factor [Bacteroidales bacterium]